MGVVNVTPDSFSDGGAFFDPAAAVSHGFRLAEEGADILDVGGESTRPGAVPVSAQEEMDRVLPVIEGLKGCGALLSIDTRHAATMREAVRAGAGMINDIHALRGEGSLAAAAESGVPVCLMHMRGQPGAMQDAPAYDDVVSDIMDFLTQRIESCVAAGIPKSRIVIDPGIGFGKTLLHNVEILKNIKTFKELNVPVLIGVSRKSFIEKICPGVAPADRLPGSLAAELWALQQGADILRVHDVAATRQAVAVLQAIEG